MMNSGQLNLDDIPDIGVPIRFFLTAPLFGMMAAVGLMIGGATVLSSRWTPELLGLTHFMTLGFITMTMCGALLQLLPVVAGAAVPRAPVVVPALHALLVVGALMLGLGLWSGSRTCLILAAASLGAVAVVFGGVVSHALLRVVTRHPTVVAMGGAVLCFVAAAGLGVVLAAGHAGAPFRILRDLTDLHARVGLVGWVAVLVIGVSYQVVPMFQLTPAYPRLLSTLLVPTLLATLVASGIRPLWEPAELAMGIALATFAGSTLRLQRRRRRRGDISLQFWRIGMVSLLLAVGLWMVHVLFPSVLAGPHVPVELGVLYVVGFGTSVISAMLYKIVPFLIWLHLKRKQLSVVTKHKSRLTMAAVIPGPRIRLQFIIHCAGVGCLLAAAYWPHWVTYPAATLLLVAWLILWLNLWTAVRSYTRFAAPDA